MLTVLGVALYFMGKSVFSIIAHFSLMRAKDFWIVYSTVQLIFISLLMIPNKYTQIINGYWMAFIAYFAMFSIVGAIVKLFPIGSLGFKIVDISKVVLTLVIVVIGAYIAKNTRIITYDVKINKNIEDLNIVVFSDIHLGYQVGYEKVKEIVKKTNDMKPDLVLIPGDIFNGNYSHVDNIEKISDELKKIESRYGVYASLGNHDVTKDEGKIKDFLKRSDITLLQDDFVVVNGITILGRKDKRPIDSFEYERITLDEIINKTDKDLPIIVLDHQPADIDSAIKDNADLIVSGHTHNGQIFPGSLITNALFKVGYGHKQFNNTNVIVTSGVGFWGPPIRIGSISEIVNIKLSSK